MRINPYPGIDCTRNSGSWLLTQICPFSDSPGHFGPFDQIDHLASNRTATPDSSNARAGHTISAASAVITHAHSNTVVASAKAPTQHYDVETPNDLVSNLPKTQIRIQEPIIRQAQTSSKQQPPQHTPYKADIHMHKITTPIKIDNLMYFLRGYEHKNHIFQGFTHGFKLGYMGPRSSSVTSNLKSCYTYPSIVADKIAKEVQLGRVKGHFGSPPFPYMKISPIGIVPKKNPGQYRLIHHLSCPEGNSVNDFIDKQFSSVQYATFDDLLSVCSKSARIVKWGKQI